MPKGSERPDFPLNRPAWRGARIIVGGRNFGCGSSREGAVYALYDYGIRCVIAPSFGDIFSGNAVQNGLLTAIVSGRGRGGDHGDAGPYAGAAGDGRSRSSRRSCAATAPTTSPSTRSRRTRLLEGLDDIALTESYRDRIAAFKASDQGRRAWAHAHRWAYFNVVAGVRHTDGFSVHTAGPRKSQFFSAL